TSMRRRRLPSVTYSSSPVSIGAAAAGAAARSAPAAAARSAPAAAALAFALVASRAAHGVSAALASRTSRPPSGLAEPQSAPRPLARRLDLGHGNRIHAPHAPAQRPRPPPPQEPRRQQRRARARHRHLEAPLAD